LAMGRVGLEAWLVGPLAGQRPVELASAVA